jgi:hypothetical protein
MGRDARMDWAAEWPSTVHPTPPLAGQTWTRSVAIEALPTAQAGGHDWGLATARDDDQQGE